MVENFRLLQVLVAIGLSERSPCSLRRVWLLLARILSALGAGCTITRSEEGKCPGSVAIHLNLDERCFTHWPHQLLIVVRFPRLLIPCSPRLCEGLDAATVLQPEPDAPEQSRKAQAQETAKTASLGGICRQDSTYPESFNLTYKEGVAGSNPALPTMKKR